MTGLHHHPLDGAMPHNLDAEQSLIGAIMLDNEAYHLIEVPLAAEHFYEPFHGVIYDIMRQRIREGRLAEPVNIAEEVKTWGAFESLGGIRYFADLVDRAPGLTSAPHFASMILDLAIRRDLVRLGGELQKQARTDHRGDATDLVVSTEKILTELASTGTTAPAFKPVGQIYRRQIERARAANGAPPGVPTGIRDLDRVLGGLRPSTVAVLAGRPGMGKSAGGVQIGVNVAQAGFGVGMFSLEMPEEQTSGRFGCALAYDRSITGQTGDFSNATFENFEKGNLSDWQWGRIEGAQETLDGLPIYLDHRSKLRVSQMLPAMRRQKREWERAGIKPGLVIVDHVLHIGPEDPRADKVTQVTQASNDILDMAKSLNMAVLLLCQLSRGVEGREDKRPGLQDLKWAGALEEDAFSVTFLYRPEYYLRPPEDDNDDKAWEKYRTAMAKAKNRLWWLVEKNRGGRAQQQVETFCDIGCNAIQQLGDPDYESGRINFRGDY